MDSRIFLLSLIAAAFAHSLPLQRPTHLDWKQLIDSGKACKECHPQQCFLPLGCPAGRVRDCCGCCWECGNSERQHCDLDPSSNFYGKCGEGLECQVLEEDVKSGDIPERHCVCSSQEIICGSDGKTYENICQFRDAHYRSREAGDLTVAHNGPCRAEPFIAVSPHDVLNMEGSDIIFGCEVFSYPMAFIEWRKEGNSIFLPADDSHIAVQARGGPQCFELTGWLQIQNIQKEDEGVYTCLAKNEFGEVSASARLQVVERDSPLAHQLQPFKTGVFDISDDDEDSDGLSSGYIY
ncbi:kazal-type serine peptidase inhibitor domain 2 [Amia ocellicauda]|uniref:kazal-type serine peptidase inhibitor domain 2 n=1 Tax=Amia ocellicauda TaxID=2972642 RepID=UPI0034647D1C